MFKRIAIEKLAGFDEKLTSFAIGCQKICDDSTERRGYYHITADQVAGSRYVRVLPVPLDQGSRSVHCFVDKTNGDVLMAAGWKAPEKNPRGNIFAADNGLSRMGPFGAAYNK